MRFGGGEAGYKLLFLMKIFRLAPEENEVEIKKQIFQCDLCIISEESRSQL